MSSQYTEHDKNVEEIYKRAQIGRSTAKPKPKKIEIEKEIMNVLRRQQSLILNLHETPDLPLGKIEDIKRSFTKTLNIVVMNTDPDVIDQLTFQLMKKQQLEKLQKEK